MPRITERQRAAMEAAARRYEARAEERRETAEQIEQGNWTKAEDESRIRTRLARKGMPDTAIDAVIAEAKETSPFKVNVLERIIKGSQLQAVSFLSAGARISKAVGRVIIRSGPSTITGYGTGFLVSPGLFLTNNHVLEDAGQAANSIVQFDYFEKRDGTFNPTQDFAFDPARFFITDQQLDFTLVAIVPTGLRGGTLAGRSWLPFIRESGKALVGEPVNIIQHPSGGPLQIAIRENPVVDIAGDFMHYRADTLQGSSGAPVCNDMWELAALHHSGVPRRDDVGNILLTDGTAWSGTSTDYDRIDWTANEGVRISRITRFIDGMTLNTDQAQLYAGAFVPPQTVPESAKTASAASAAPVPGGAPQGDGGMSLYFKVTIEPVGMPAGAQLSSAAIPMPAPVSPAPLPSAPVSPNPDTASADLAASILDQNRGDERTYYDADQDAQDRAAYYGNVDLNGSPEALFSSLHALMKDSHHTELTYKAARLKHLYPWVDLRPGNLELFSIYSDDEMPVEEVMRSEIRRLASQKGEPIDCFCASDLEDMLDGEDEDMDAAFEAINGAYNCEHVVPQSWFEKRQPMRADLHHLFACEARCNSFRSNIPYFDFDPLQEAERTDCGRRSAGKFEPTYNHGVVARATLYFLLRYPGEVGNSESELSPDRLVTLIRWHKSQKVDLYELHRNAEIAKVQGNRNPLIDFPDLIDKIDFSRAFARI